MSGRFNVRHGGPYDRGSADRYYGRPFNPHYYLGGTATSPIVERVDMDDEDIIAYTAGYNEETDRKNWD